MALELTRIAGNCADGRTCPARYRTNRGTIMTVGKRVTDSAELALMPVGPDEVVNEVPDSLYADGAADGG